MKLRAAISLAGACLLGGSLVAPTVASADPGSVVAGRFFSADKEKKKKKKATAKKRGKKAKAAKKEKGDGPAELDKKVPLSPRGLAWGMSSSELSELYGKVFDTQFLPLYRRLQPGPRMQALDAELADKKQLLKRNLIKFGSTPTGYDYGALKGEYCYRNKESLTHLTSRKGTKRHFFFFDDRLWKVYDEHKLGKKSRFGKTFKIAVKRLTKTFKVAPRLREENPDEGLTFTTADWQDGSTIIRALDRGDVIALVYEDQNVVENIGRYRTAEDKDPNAIDKDVERVTTRKKPSADDDEKKKKKKGK